MQEESNGWLLSTGLGSYGVVGERELIHVLPYSPKLYAVPHTPEYCRNVMVWQELIVPVVDLAARLQGGHEGPLTYDTTTKLGIKVLVGIVAYHDEAGAGVNYGALLLNQIPARIKVQDGQACESRQAAHHWSEFAVSCFEHPEHGQIPILDLPYIFLGNA
jgi:chemotaxis signal transduction protein